MKRYQVSHNILYRFRSIFKCLTLTFFLSILFYCSSFHFILVRNMRSRCGIMKDVDETEDQALDHSFTNSKMRFCQQFIASSHTHKIQTGPPTKLYGFLVITYRSGAQEHHRPSILCRFQFFHAHHLLSLGLFSYSISLSFRCCMMRYFFFLILFAASVGLFSFSHLFVFVFSKVSRRLFFLTQCRTNF